MSKEPMTCEAAREAIDGLTAQRAAIAPEEVAFHAHLARCSRCREFYEETRAQNRLLVAWVAPSPRGNTEARVMAGIARQEREWREQERRRGPWERAIDVLFGRRIQMPAAAALALTMLMLISLGLNAVLLSSPREGIGGRAGVSEPAPTVVAANPDGANVVRPVLMPIQGDAGTALIQALAQPELNRTYWQGTGAMPLGIVVILGVPPVKSDREGLLAGI